MPPRQITFLLDRLGPPLIHDTIHILSSTTFGYKLNSFRFYFLVLVPQLGSGMGSIIQGEMDRQRGSSNAVM
ncbi:hypothetical protein JTE90_017766 [Oedothorax gibbosus]|uniref:Uncharacterized protein n=1 Tax=Oedothorax gibbosus TaxID=931172 RepID=A0AAV6UL04_9ARAC|nr:hypothetical protein JTE90_017766 [Oedothorax gibbosus]